ncbi:MAG: hypothetical protein ACTHJ4_00990 [Candidatus Nucleicultricaceae bacterium]
MKNISLVLFKNNKYFLRFLLSTLALITTSTAFASKFIDYDATGNPTEPHYTSPRGKEYFLCDRTINLRHSPLKQRWMCEDKKPPRVSKSADTLPPISIVSEESIEKLMMPEAVSEESSEKQMATAVVLRDLDDKEDNAPPVPLVFEKDPSMPAALSATSIENVEALRMRDDNEKELDESVVALTPQVALEETGVMNNAQATPTPKPIAGASRSVDDILASIFKDREIRPYRRMAEFFEEHPHWSSTGPSCLPESLKRQFEERIKTSPPPPYQSMTSYFEALETREDEEDFY